MSVLILVGNVLITLLLGGILPPLHRRLVYLCYCRFPKHHHFHSCKTYYRYCYSWFVQGLLWAYLLIAVIGVGCVWWSSKQMIVLNGFKMVWGVLFAAQLVLISSVDFKLYLIPLRLLGCLGVWILLLRLTPYILHSASSIADVPATWEAIVFYPYDGIHQISWWLQRCLLSMLLWCLYYFLRKGLGIADIYFLWILTLLFDTYTWLWGIVVACILGIAYALIRNTKDFLPFGPCIALSAWVMWLSNEFIEYTL